MNRSASTAQSRYATHAAPLKGDKTPSAERLAINALLMKLAVQREEGELTATWKVWIWPLPGCTKFGGDARFLPARGAAWISTTIQGLPSEGAVERFLLGALQLIAGGAA